MKHFELFAKGELKRAVYTKNTDEVKRTCVLAKREISSQTDNLHLQSTSQTSAINQTPKTTESSGSRLQALSWSVLSDQDYIMASFDVSSPFTSADLGQPGQLWRITGQHLYANWIAGEGKLLQITRLRADYTS
ncbi:hypothetical protein T265_09624 [Opisthorchis viverrini]|uniref:Uncharacterized protein n=1 Tax=Opisthorchis viverrini TaxID=6198 RepID=A0A074ZG58_OPIVI|nr:hypothetical protein T265_09624 [Opisthorchis viverrini]KER22230.1 hypothetical protein T265_09624 [Opisthorchis viverrini]